MPPIASVSPSGSRRPPDDQRRLVAILAAVLALQTADIASVGAVAVQLERDLGISDTQLGLLVTATALVGALATVPAGALADRRPRVPILAAITLLWALALFASALAPGYRALLGARLALGIVTAAASPLVASLTGDYFPPGDRARIFGSILAGELVGAGAGFLLVGGVSAALGWRSAIALLGAAALALPIVVWRMLPEPRRSAGESGGTSLIDAARHVLRIPTNVILIGASALGYFYLTGIQTFGVAYARARFDVGQALGNGLIVVVGAGALVGVTLGGRIADHRLAAGQPAARVSVAAIATLTAAVLFVPGLLSDRLATAIPILMCALAALAAANPPLDAARLDVVPSALWGRAESIRVVARSSLVAFAPLSFGLVADALGGEQAGLQAPASAGGPGEGAALTATLLIMLATLGLSGILLLLARASYPRDVAAAEAGERPLGGRAAHSGGAWTKA